MPTDKLLVALTVAGSALCWCPVIIQPNLDLPYWWVSLALVALGTALPTTLSNESWLRLVCASIAGSFLGLFFGFWILPLTDGIERAYSPIAVATGALAAIPVSLVSGLILRNVSVSSERHRRAIWIALVCCVAFGPVALALASPLVAYRVARNDRIAAKRFGALKNAVEQTMEETDGPAHICDGQALRRRYSGLPFSDSDWRYIVGNAVKEDGYVFWINCHQKNGYSIDARPARQKGDGSRHFCTDQSGQDGCDLE